MNRPDLPNPERRSNMALLCFGIGAGLIGLAWVLGFGGVFTMVFAGAVPGVALGAAAGMVGIVLAGVTGALLMLIGSIWLLAQVIADQREEHDKERYSRDVER